MAGSHSISLLFVVFLAIMVGVVVRAWMREARTQVQKEAERPTPQPVPAPLSPEDVERLLDQLGSSNAAEAKSADRKLGEYFRDRAESRSSEILRPIINVATREGAHDAARSFCLGVLAAIQVPGARQILLNALRAQSPEVRAAAAQGLWHLRDPTTVASLIEVLLNDSSYEVKSSVTSTLGWIKSPEAVPALMFYFEKGDKRAKVDAMWALGAIGDPRSLLLARAALAHRYRRLREAAKMALGEYDFKRRERGPKPERFLP